MTRVNDSSNYVPKDFNLPNVKSGDGMTPRFFQRLTQGIERNGVVDGVGYSVKKLSNATILSVDSARPNISAPTNFKVVVSSDKKIDTNGHAYLYIGTINRYIPKINGVFMDGLDSTGKQPHVNFSTNGYIMAKVTYLADKPFPSESEIVFRSSIPTDTSTESYYPLASVTWNLNPTTEAIEVSSTQIHMSKNLSVNRFKVGSSTYYWQWYTV